MVQLVVADTPILTVLFFRTKLGREPVRTWLKDFDKEDRKI
ncbi:hypothetical protein MNBD_CHLOROFLEXI01-1374, partial [hydrothermal vent metagenome]